MRLRLALLVLAALALIAGSAVKGAKGRMPATFSRANPAVATGCTFPAAFPCTF